MAIDGFHTDYIDNVLMYLTLRDMDGFQPVARGYVVDNGARLYVEMVDHSRCSYASSCFPKKKDAPI